MKIIGLGNALVDILIPLQNDSFLTDNHLPKGSMQLIDAELSDQLLHLLAEMPKTLASGGSASNTIHGLANLGVSTAYIGKIGTDAYGGFFKEDMVRAGIRPVLLTGKQNTGTALTFISPDSERTFGTHLGAAVEMEPAEIGMDHLAGYDLLHIEGYLVFNQDLTKHVVTLAKKAGLKISLDMASFNVVEANHTFLHEIITDYIDIIFANEEEAKAFTGESPEMALKTLAGLCEIAVVKMGGDGSWVESNGMAWKVEPTPTELRDTTGAGDLYASGFLFGLSKNLPIPQCGALGSLLAGKVIEVIGAKIDRPRWDQIHHAIGAKLF